MLLLGWILGIVIAIAAIWIAVAFMNRFYRKSTRDIALVRTGFGGQKIVLSGDASPSPSCTRSRKSTCARTESRFGAPATSR